LLNSTPSMDLKTGLVSFTVMDISKGQSYAASEILQIVEGRFN